jgi:hypothetical protein
MKIHLAQYSTILQYIQIHVNWCFPTGKLLDGNRLRSSKVVTPARCDVDIKLCPRLHGIVYSDESVLGKRTKQPMRQV